MKQSIRINDGAELNRLAAQVCLQSIRDLIYSKDPIKRLDALLFVTGPDFQIWSEAGSLDFPDPYKVLPNLRQVKDTLRTRSI